MHKQLPVPLLSGSPTRVGLYTVGSPRQVPRGHTGSSPARVRLNIDPPLVGTDMESLQCALLAEVFNPVNVLVASIVTGAWLPLRVLVGQAGTQSLDDGQGGEVL